MDVITISSELGSGGTEIAGRVAATLGHALVDERTCDDILRKYGLTKFNDLYGSAPGVLDLVRVDNLLVIAMYNEILEALARRGRVVIVSRVGFAVLGGYGDVLNVRVTAPPVERARRLLAGAGPGDLGTADERVREDDNAHRKFAERFYGRKPDDPSGYGLTVDTGTVSVEEAAGQVVAAARAALELPPADAATTTAAIEVDPVLATAVAEVMASGGLS